MCGIAGLVDVEGRLARDKLRGIVSEMCAVLHHRGPDAGGLWYEDDSGVVLGHRRLSILDLSPEGAQPMSSSCGRFVISFNGEIYNFSELRGELLALGHAFRGRSDTEVILASVRQWGIVKALERFVGMFAFALWDKEEKRLTLARDRIGEKPLYYGWVSGVFGFASEVKALRLLPGWKGEVDRGSLNLFLRHSCIPDPFSIYQGVQKLLPGTILTLECGGRGVKEKVYPYWELKDAVRRGRENPFVGDAIEAEHALELKLRKTVRRQMISDVPLGAFLSGGIDSSLLVALMQAQSVIPVRTFTIGFEEHAYNEAVHAQAVARHIGTEHTQLYIRPEDALAAIPQLPQIYDEPFADSSQIPTYLVSKLTRNHVTVALSGDGGDEFFGGYVRYQWEDSLRRFFALSSPRVRKVLAGGISRLGSERMDRIFHALQYLAPKRWRQEHWGDKLAKLGELLALGDPDDIYLSLLSQWKNPESVVLRANEPETLLRRRDEWPTELGSVERMMYLDALSYLPADIMVKVDRASMAVSLESRAPYLDHEIAEFAWSLPLNLKLRGGVGKWISRRILYRYVPKSLVDRPKKGFGIPLQHWLRGPLRDWAESLLAPSRLRQEGFFDVAVVRDRWNEHVSGKRNWSFKLWNVLMFQAWFEHWCKDKGVPAVH